MEKVAIAEVLSVVKGELISPGRENYITGISTDTRTLRPGDFFIPLKGEKYDGHQFISEAVRKGAVGTFAAKDKIIPGSFSHKDFTVIKVADTLRALQNLAAYFRRKFNPLIIAITGSNGKTTTKEMLGNILGQFAPTLVNYANWNNQIGLPLTLLQLEAKHRYCVLEMGTNQRGEIGHLSEIARPKIVIFTNIGRTHLQAFKTPEGVLEEKVSVLNFLPPDGEIVYNADDTLLSDFAFSLKKTGFAIEKKTDVYATDIEEKEGKNQFFLHFNREKIRISLSLLGRFNIYNALAASACALRVGINGEKIATTLESFSSLPGRMNVLRLLRDTILVDDSYNANPNSMREAIGSFLHLFPDHEKILVLGDMLELGEKSVEEHYALGKYINSLPVKTIFLYGKEVLALAKGIGNSGSQEVLIFDKKNELVENLKNFLQPGRAIFFKASRLMKLEELVEVLIQTDKETIQTR